MTITITGKLYLEKCGKHNSKDSSPKIPIWLFKQILT